MALNDIAMNEPSGGNFELVSPMDNDADYIVAVEGQTRGERGDYGLKLAFGVAEDLVSGDYADTTLGDARLTGARTGELRLRVGGRITSFLLLPPLMQETFS